METFKWMQTPVEKKEAATAKNSAWATFTNQFPNADKSKFIAQVHTDQNFNITAKIFLKKARDLCRVSSVRTETTGATG